jgi:hypothetical protein
MKFIKGNHNKSYYEDPHSSHYEIIHLSHSPWGSPTSWNEVPKVEMHKFDRSNQARWVCLIEQYFSLHDIQDDETKLHVGFMYLDQECWWWWQWHKKCYPGLPTWNMFTKECCARFDKEYHILGRLTNLCQIEPVEDLIMTISQIS